MSAINVNTKPCNFVGHCSVNREGHDPKCDAAPVPLRCPLPGSFTAEMPLGECTATGARPETVCGTVHADACPARPVKVTCSIGGDGTWAGSEVEECTVRERLPAPWEASLIAVDAACRARWEIVKALVTGSGITFYHGSSLDRLLRERTAAFATIAKVRAHEDGLYDTLGELPSGVAGYAGRPVGVRFDFAERALAAYVASLITSVGAL